MSRDVKLSRRESSKLEEEIENIPENFQSSFLSQISNDDSSSSSSLPRAPLNTIQDPLNNPKETRNKIEGTPSKPRAKNNPDPPLPLRTPDNNKHHRSAAFSKNRFGWGEKCDSVANASANTTPKAGRVAGRANSCYSESNSTQNTPTKSVTKPPGSCYRGKLDGVRAGGGYASLYKGSSGQVSAVVNTVEVPHFDLKEDPSFWMDHNVQVPNFVSICSLSRHKNV